MNEMDNGFEKENQQHIQRMSRDRDLQKLSLQWLTNASRYKYSYHYQWLGLPIIQFPQDILAMQEIIWRVKPERIIETGVARGGSVIFYASMLDLLGGDGRVIGIDVDIRPKNRAAIVNHPLSKRIDLIEGSSISVNIVEEAASLVQGKKTLVVLDSLHTHDHSLQEMERYSPFVTKGSYLVVFDTIIEDMPADFFPDRPWGRGNNPKTAVWEFLRRNDRFEIDRDIQNKLLITVAPDGYLRCLKDLKDA